MFPPSEADGRTDSYNESGSRFSQSFANTPKTVNDKKGGQQYKLVLTSPPLSFSPMMFGCAANWLTMSAVRSIPVLAGMLYMMTGTELRPATVS